MSEDYVDYVFLLPGNTFSRQFLNSWSQTLTALSELGVTYRWYVDYTPIISLTRNRLLGYSGSSSVGPKLSTTVFEGKLNCKKVMFIDSDIVWSVSDIFKLLTNTEPVIGGAYVTADKYHIAALQDGRTMNIHDLTGDLIPVTSMGLGFVACAFEVVKDLKYPWFSVIENMDGSRVTEDVYFFNRVKSAGYTPYLDSSIRLGHIKDEVLNTWGDK